MTLNKKEQRGMRQFLGNKYEKHVEKISSETEVIQLDPRRWIGLWVVLSGSFLAGMDGFIVNVALPSIQKDLTTDFASLQFVVAGYALIYAVLLVTGGRLGDLYGRKRIFLVGMASFVLASALCGFALHPLALVMARFLQGAAAALLFPQILGLVRVTFTGRERDQAFGLYGMTIGLSQISGLVLGSLLLATNIFGLGWRALFLINVPIGVVALTLTIFFVREATLPGQQKLDLGGVGLATLGLGLLIFPLIEGREAGWPWWTFLSLTMAFFLLFGFFFYERAVETRNGAPLLSRALLENSAFLRGLLMVLLFFSATGAFLLVITFYLQSGLGQPAPIAGLTTLPFALGVFLASFAATPIKKRLGTYVLSGGAGSMIMGILMFIGSIVISGSKPTGLALLPGMFLIGFGFGLILSPLMSVLLGSIEAVHASVASGMIGTCMQTGLSLGVAFTGVIFFSLLTSHATYTQAFLWSLGSLLGILLLALLLIFSLPQEKQHIKVVE